MPKFETANEIIKKIWECTSRDSEVWFSLEKEVKEKVKSMDQEECEYLRRSGYCESLGMICDSFRYEMDKEVKSTV